jgi:hypothetical protein
MIHELQVEGTAEDVAREVRKYEETARIRPVKRLMDPNIATETNDKLQRGWNMRRAYDEVGLRCDLATDDVNTGIQEVIHALRPDSRTRRPRLAFFNTCGRAIQSHKSWSWEEWTRANEKEPKESPRDKYKDMCDVVRYFLMDRPTFSGYQLAGSVYRRR